MNLFWEAYQHGRIARADYTAAKAEVKANNTRLDLSRQMREMEEKIDHLALKCQALWELVKDELNLTDTQIAERIGAIDLRDGIADGKMTRHPECPQCGRPVGTRHFLCPYCNHPMGGTEIFDT